MRTVGEFILTIIWWLGVVLLFIILSFVSFVTSLFSKEGEDEG